jgi:hypothetical protein
VSYFPVHPPQRTLSNFMISGAFDPIGSLRIARVGPFRDLWSHARQALRCLAHVITGFYGSGRGDHGPGAGPCVGGGGWGLHVLLCGPSLRGRRAPVRGAEGQSGEILIPLV